MKILFLGALTKFTFSRYSFDILKKKYNTVDIIDTDKVFFFNKIFFKFIFYLS